MTNSDERDPYLELLDADDPVPLVNRLREEDPVHWVPEFGFWFVTRHDDVKRLFNDPENVERDRRFWEHYTPAPEGSMRRWLDDEGMGSQGPEHHSRVRRLVSSAFTPRAIGRMEEQIREVVDRFSLPLRGRHGEVIDLMGDFTSRIPNVVISRITGVPPAGDGEVRFASLAQEMIRAFFPLAKEDAIATGEAAFAELAPWVREMVAERRRSPREDLVSDLVAARDRDEALTDDEIVLLVTLLIGAGSETTAMGGLIMIGTLLQHERELERVREDRGLLPSAVNEILRCGFGGPAGIQRYAARDFSLRGQQIRKGQMLMLSFAGAHRDPSAYPDPNVFDIGRDAKDLLVFGNGPYYCLGANLARQEMACMLDAFLDIVPPGSRLREDLQFHEEMGLFKRPTNFPVEVAKA